jgi:hypothetical protein
MLVPREGCYRYYFPYVEEALLPAGVREGESSAIELRISAEYRPVILQGYTANEFQGVLFSEYQYEVELPENKFAIMRRPFFDGKHEFEMNLELQITEPPGEGEPVESFIYHLPPLPASKYLVRVFAARERQWGGIGWYGANPGEVPASFRPEGDPFNWLNRLDNNEYSFEILPAETPE